MDFLGFEFSPDVVVGMLAGAWATGLVLGAVSALLASVARRR